MQCRPTLDGCIYHIILASAYTTHIHIHDANLYLDEMCPLTWLLYRKMFIGGLNWETTDGKALQTPNSHVWYLVPSRMFADLYFKIPSVSISHNLARSLSAPLCEMALPVDRGVLVS